MNSFLKPESNGAVTKGSSATGEPCAADSLESFTKTLYGIVPQAVAFVEAFADSQSSPLPSVSTIVRSLLVAGAGKGYEPAVQHAIRYFVYAYQEVRRWEHRKDISEAERADNLAAWNREMRDRQETLKLLEVEVVEVNVGDRIDEALHSVNSRDLRETDDPVVVNTVAEVKTPAFRWVDDRGNQTVTHAEVIAFASQVRSKSQSRDLLDSPYRSRSTSRQRSIR